MSETIVRIVIEEEPVSIAIAATEVGGGGSATYAGLSDKATVDLPAVNNPLASALAGKQPLDADLTAIAALTTTANGRALLTSANALTIGASASVSGTNTGDQDLSYIMRRRSTLTVLLTDPEFPDFLYESDTLTNNRKAWYGSDTSLEWDGTIWVLQYGIVPDVLYRAEKVSASYEPWLLLGWTVTTGLGQPTFSIDPAVPLGTGVNMAIELPANTNGGFLTAGTGGTLPLARGGTGSTTASDARIALGGVGDSSTGTALFGAADAAAALTTLGGGTAATGSGAVVLANSPTLVTPNIGAATGDRLTLGNGGITTPALTLGTVGVFSRSSGIFTVKIGTAGIFEVLADQLRTGTQRISFTPTTNAGVAADCFINRTGAGQFAFGTTSGGSQASVTLTNLTASGTIRTGGYTFATLPTPTQGMRTFITDGAALPVYMANAAGGSTVVTPVFYNGTNWINA
jgi:hypothetical protein